jgi:hypothetical protein
MSGRPPLHVEHGAFLQAVVELAAGLHPDLSRARVRTCPEGPQWSVGRAAGSLIGASVLAAWMSEILVGAAEGSFETTDALDV